MALLHLQPESGGDEPRPPYTEPIDNGRVLVLCCEGICSRAYTLETKMVRLRAAGYDADQIRSEVSFRLVSTPHQACKRLVNERGRTVVYFYQCVRCKHIRQYGAEEME